MTRRLTQQRRGRHEPTSRHWSGHYPCGGCDDGSGRGGGGCGGQWRCRRRSGNRDRGEERAEQRKPFRPRGRFDIRRDRCGRTCGMAAASGRRRHRFGCPPTPSAVQPQHGYRGRGSPGAQCRPTSQVLAHPGQNGRAYLHRAYLHQVNSSLTGSSRIPPLSGALDDARGPNSLHANRH